MVSIKTQEEIALMREGGKILAAVLVEVAAMAKPGATTAELDEKAERLLHDKGALPAFKGFDGYPASLCTSVNEQVVHGLPSDYKLKEGDVVGLDLGAIYPPEKCGSCPHGDFCGGQQGLYTDMAMTVAVGEISPEVKKIIAAAKRVLEIAIDVVKPGRKISDISQAVQKYVEGEGFSVIRDLVGHGVGRELHEKPAIPNFVGSKHKDAVLEEGMTLAIEPMIAAGDWKLKKSADGYGYETVDKSLAAHFEHTVLVTKDGCEVLTRI